MFTNKYMRLRQKFYIWRKFRNIEGPSKLSRALHARMAEMSRKESHAYYAAPVDKRAGVQKKHYRERKMIVSILDMLFKTDYPDPRWFS